MSSQDTPHPFIIDTIGQLASSGIERAVPDQERVLFSIKKGDVKSFLMHYEALKKAVSAGRLLCANLDHGGHGKDTLIEHFRVLADATIP